MADLTNPRVIKLKGGLFLVLGLLSSLLLLVPDFSTRNLVLLAIAIWSFCRFYYFAFYVIEHYVDPNFRFAGLWDFARYMAQAAKKTLSCLHSFPAMPDRVLRLCNTRNIGSLSSA